MHISPAPAQFPASTTDLQLSAPERNEHGVDTLACFVKLNAAQVLRTASPISGLYTRTAMSSASEVDDRKPAAKASPQPSIEAGTPDDDQVGTARPPPDGTPEQLEEFNQWLARWQRYQTELSDYWQRRYSAIYGPKLAKLLGSSHNRKYEPANTTAEFKWKLRYQELLDFKAEHGTVHVPKAFEYHYTAPGLGVWASKQKELITKEKLEDAEAAKKAKLELIGFFDEEPKDKLKFTMAWHSLYLILKEFRNLNGHVEVSCTVFSLARIVVL